MLLEIHCQLSSYETFYLTLKEIINGYTKHKNLMKEGIVIDCEEDTLLGIVRVSIPVIS